MPSIKEFALTQKNTLNIEWSKIENALGFNPHENVKDFYSRILAKRIEGTET